MVELQIGDPLLARGDLIDDARFGVAQIIEVAQKYVWYKVNGRTHRTSKDRALRMFNMGTAFTTESDTPRWSHY